MTDFNDGKWYDTQGLDGWPCHVKSMVERVWLTADTEVGGRVDFGVVASLDWSSEYGRTTAFRVVKAYHEPREWWVHADIDGRIRECSASQPRAFIVREVIE